MKKDIKTHSTAGKNRKMFSDYSGMRSESVGVSYLTG